jgi:hypothetical protein
MDSGIFKNISRIIERDSKTTTYKYALLRGVIDIIQENSPYVTISKNKVHFPVGLMVEKWLLYYYPVLECATKIPQINGQSNLAFGNQFLKIIEAYKNIGGFSAFYNDLKNKGLPHNLQSDFLELAYQLRKTITTMPMKYIGRSLCDQYYSIFQVESSHHKLNTSKVDLASLIGKSGNFSIPVEYYEAFKILGSFIGGQDSLFFKWAEFSVNASKGSLSVQKVISEVLKSPITEREIGDSKRMYNAILKREGKVYCVWSGSSVTKYDVDHVIPFSIWKNNDLWNLLPSGSTLNREKSDKIPSADLIERRKDLIFYYWDLIAESYSERFQNEIRIALLGENNHTDWKTIALSQLKRSCNYLISYRGFEEWNK